MSSWPAYLLGSVSWPLLESFQRRLIYDLSGDPTRGTVLFCDHPPGLSLGLAGSRSQIRLWDQTLQARRWSVRWLSHGGGLMLHTPGQVACYPQINLSTFNFTPASYVQQLGEVLLKLLALYDLKGELDPETMLLRVRGRAIASMGVSIRRGVTSFGFVFNVSPDLELFKELAIGGDTRPMTSLQRESPALRARVPTVRGQLLNLLASLFNLESWTIYHHHPLLMPRGTTHASTAAHR